MTIPITGQPPVPSLSEPDTFNTKALNLFIWQTGSMLDQFNNVDPNDFFDIPALTAAAAQSQTKNAIINGAFDVWQRGTTITSTGFAADRWKNDDNGGTVIQSRQTFPAGTKLGLNTPTYFLQQAVSGQTGSQVAFTGHKIEDVRSFAGETTTVLGWMRRSGGVGNASVNFEQQFGSGGSSKLANGKIDVVLTGSWEPFAVVSVVPSISGKTIGDGSYIEMRVWSSGGGVPTKDITLDFWGIHILHGTHGVEACDNYVAPRVVDELPRCQRYFEQTQIDHWFRAAIASEETLITHTYIQKRATPSTAHTDVVTLNSISAAINALSTSSARIKIRATSSGEARYSATVSMDAEL